MTPRQKIREAANYEPPMSKSDVQKWEWYVLGAILLMLAIVPLVEWLR